jgi:hypothetical protein
MAQVGQAVVMVILALFVLTMAGLAIDGGRMFEERRAAQTGADHAATTAAYVSCSGGDEIAAQTAGQQAATRNGYDDSAAPVVVNVHPVVGQANTFKAEIRSSIPGTFARILGINEFTISVEATAAGLDCGAAGAGAGAIFAGGTCVAGQLGLDVSGSDAGVYGGVHTNWAASTSGSNNRFFAPGIPEDPFTYVGALQNSGSNNLFQSPDYPRNEGAKPWPDGLRPADVNVELLSSYEALALANGSGPSDDTFFTSKVTEITKDGVYYTTSEDGMDISSISWSAVNDRTVTLIAPNGPIKISVSNAGGTLHAFSDPSLPRDNLLILSNESFTAAADRCSKYAISVSGQATQWTGTMWAPGGLIEFSGSDGSTIDGSVVGWAVRLAGQSIDISFDPTATGADPTIVLLE